MEFFFIPSMEKKKSEDKTICNPSSFPIHPLSFRKVVKRSTTQIPPKNIGFINHVFCRNWAVRNPALTRLDSSSLVNEQVAIIAPSRTCLLLLAITVQIVLLLAVSSRTISPKFCHLAVHWNQTKLEGVGPVDN